MNKSECKMLLCNQTLLNEALILIKKEVSLSARRVLTERRSCSFCSHQISLDVSAYFIHFIQKEEHPCKGCFGFEHHPNYKSLVYELEEDDIP